MTPRAYSERDIHLAMDGELAPDDRPGYERWLANHPDMRALAQRYAEDREQMLAELAGILAERPPERLTKVLSMQASNQPGHRGRIWRYAAAAVLIMLGGLAGYLISPRIGSNPSTLVQIADNAIAAHVIYSNEKTHVVEVGADQLDHLQGWLSKKVGVKLVAPNFRNQGFELIGGRLLPLGQKTAAQFMYQDPTGNRVSLYVTRDESGADTGYRVTEERGTRAVYWLDGGYGCAVAGAASERLLSAIADSTYKQLLEGDKT